MSLSETWEESYHGLPDAVSGAYSFLIGGILYSERSLQCSEPGLPDVEIVPRVEIGKLTFRL